MCALIEIIHSEFKPTEMAQYLLLALYMDQHLKQFDMFA